MDIILPAAGFGTRLRPQTWSKPKPLVTVAGKPMIEHVLDRLMPYGPEKLVFIVGYLGDQLETWARSTYTDVEVVVKYQPQMLGQSDAILRTRDVCRDDALILFPDALFEADFSGLAELDVDGVAYTKVIDDPSAYGIAVVEDGRITRLVEKPSEPISNLALIGIYYFKQVQDLYAAMDDQIAREIKTRGEYFLSDAVEIMVENGKHFVTKAVESWEDCGNTEALLQTNRYLLSHDSPSPVQRPGSVINHPSFVHREAVLENAVVGPYASIGAGSVIRNAVLRDVIVGDNSTVEDVVLERSIIGDGVEVSGSAATINIGDAGKIAL
ncbi:MAG TPA: sugar phosphate nucleotidyltransferase [Thermomicrobiales bacterium]|nr:sugar phosphate nucleotidyltransferase [Thermomicrobiales bacterium]